MSLQEQYYIRAYNQKNLYDLTPNEWKSRIIIAKDHCSERTRSFFQQFIKTKRSYKPLHPSQTSE